MQLPLKGIIPPMLTPLLNYDKLDNQGLENMVEYLISGGVHGLFILGTNGEATSLSYKIRKELVKKTCELVDHRIPVLVGITDTSIESSLDMAESSEKSGAVAVVISPPYYFPLNEKEVDTYFETITSRLSLPFLLYNIPSHTKINITLESVKKMKEKGALGIKDSSGDMMNLYMLINEFKDSPDFSIIAGTELFLPETIMNGGHGAVAGGANLFPELFVKLYEASLKKDLKTISQLREKVLLLYTTIYAVGNNATKYTLGAKCGLSVKGICSDYMAPPNKKFNAEQRKQIEKHLEDLQLS